MNINNWYDYCNLENIKNKQIIDSSKLKKKILIII